MRAWSTYYLCTLLATLSLLLSTSRAFSANWDDILKQQQSLTGLNGTISQAAAATSVMDKSYAAAGLSHLGSFSDGGYVRLTLEDVLDLAYKLRKSTYETLILTSFQMQTGGGATIGGPTVLLSNPRLGLDIGYQYLHGEVIESQLGRPDKLREASGNGVSIRVALYPEGRRLAERTFGMAGFNEQLITILTQLIKLVGGHKKLVDITKAHGYGDDAIAFADRIRDTVSEITERGSNIRVYYSDTAFRPRLALIAGYRDLNIGIVKNWGFSASILYPFSRPDEHNHPKGLFALFSWQESKVHPRGFAPELLQTWGLALAIQDQVPVNKPNESIDRRRWRWQSGLEINVRIGRDTEWAYGAFARYRPNRFVEYGALAELTSDHHLLVGLNVNLSAF